HAFSQVHRELHERLNQLRHDNEQLGNVVRNMAEGVIALDVESRIVLANEASRRMLEVASDIYEGRHLWEVTRLRSLQEVVDRAMASDRPSQMEIESVGTGRRT